MGLIANIRRRTGSRTSWPTLTVDDYNAMLSYGGLNYLLGNQTLAGEKQEAPAASFAGYVQAGYQANGVVFACMLARLLLFSEARFQFRRMQSGRPGELFGSAELAPLERPWPNGTTGDLLARMIQDADLAGNFYAAKRPGGRVKRMRPDWVTIVLGGDASAEDDPYAIDADVVGYLYKPGGPTSRSEPTPLLPEEVVHFAPIPDPLARFRGMSWLTPVVREIMADGAATSHKLKFFENGATPNMVVSLKDVANPEAFERWIRAFEDKYGGDTGVANAYKTMYLAGGATAEVVGANMQQISFKETQGHGETRIAAAAGVPPIIVGLSEGLEAATYSNYGQARRRFADGTMRPLWRNAAASLATIVNVPAGAELWYDDRDIPFLQEDVKDAAEVQFTESKTVKFLIDSGYEADAVIDAVVAGDLSRLKGKHTGLTSAQLRPPAADSTTPADEAGRALAELVQPHLTDASHLNGRKEELAT